MYIFCPWSCLYYPSSFCPAGTRTTAGDPWLCKLQRNKHELPVNTPSPNTHRLLVLQISPLHSERRQYFFLIVPPQYYWPLLHVCAFLYSLIVPSIRRWRIDFKIIELVVGEMTNMHEVPARTRKSRKIRIVAGRRFWRFLLVNQLPLSIMAVHAQYRATAPLKSITANSRVCLFVEGRGYFFGVSRVHCRGSLFDTEKCKEVSKEN